MTRLRTSPPLSADTHRAIAPVDPTALAVVAATLYLEVRAGRRPWTQVEPLASARVHRRLRALVARQRRERGPAGVISVRRVVSQRIHDGLVEAAVVVHDTNRVTVVAVRLEIRTGGRSEATAGRWLVTDLGSPEDYLRPRGAS